MAVLFSDIGTLAKDASFRLRVQSAIADKAQAFIDPTNVTATDRQKSWARAILRDIESTVQINAYSWFVASVPSVTLTTTDSALRVHMDRAVSALAAV